MAKEALDYAGYGRYLVDLASMHNLKNKYNLHQLFLFF